MQLNRDLVSGPCKSIRQNKEQLSPNPILYRFSKTILKKQFLKTFFKNKIMFDNLNMKNNFFFPYSSGKYALIYNVKVLKIFFIFLIIS